MQYFRDRSASLFAIPMTVGVAIIVASCAGCAQYTKVSPTGYEYTKALYSVCNRRDDARLALVATSVEEARVNEQLSPSEAGWIGDIITTAQAGDWKDATRDARRLLEAQVER